MTHRLLMGFWLSSGGNDPCHKRNKNIKKNPNNKKKSDPKFFLTKMNFNENDLWRDKTKLLNLRFSKLHSAKVLLKLEFDTKDQVLSFYWLKLQVISSMSLMSIRRSTCRRNY